MKNKSPCNQLLKLLRAQKLFTQQQLADLLFVSKPTYASWEKDYTKIPLGKFSKLIDLLEINTQCVFIFVAKTIERETILKTNINFENDYLFQIKK